MFQKTHVRQRLAFGHNTVAYWANEPDRTLLLFLHGFQGKSLSTWKQLNTILPEACATRTDLVFCGYDGFGAHVDLSAVLLSEFLANLIDRPAFVPLPPVARNPADRYRRIVFVAHSMGAIVLRRALLLIKPLSSTWAQNVRLVFVAPAHAGARVPELIKEVAGYSGLLRSLVGVVKYRGPAYDDMSNPDTFTALADDVRAAISAGRPREILIGFSTTFGEHERVVVADRQGFCDDPKPGSGRFRVVPHKDHTTVCKTKDPSDPIVNIICEALS